MTHIRATVATRWLACVIMLGLPVRIAAQTSPTERAIGEYVDAHATQAIALLERVVTINSGTMNLDGVRRVGDVFRAELDALGFATRWIPMDEVHRAGHLFGEMNGTGPRMLLIGHLDTVFEDDSPFQDWELLDDDMAKGPGTEDMKGGDVVIILALQALQAAGVLEGMNLTVALMGDEESTGKPLAIGRRDLIAAGEQSDIALGFEGGVGGTGTATVARRGFTGWTIRATGTRAHSSQIFRPDLGSGAIFEAARILSEFHTEMPERYLTFNPGMILGGTSVDFDPAMSRGTAFGKTNVIAEAAVITGDLRTISIAQRERAKDRMRTIVANHLPGTSADIEFVDSYPPMGPTDANYELLAVLDGVSRDLGLGPVRPVDPGRRGAADVSFVADVVGAALDGLGVVGSGGHTPNETVQLSSITLMAKRAAVLMYRLWRERAGH